MVLSIKSAEADQTRRLARETALKGMFERAAKLPGPDDRPIDALLGYNEHGTWD